MTKKHFEAAAEICRNTKKLSERALLIRTFTEFFQSFNSRFDADRFRSACNPE